MSIQANLSRFDNCPLPYQPAHNYSHTNGSKMTNLLFDSLMRCKGFAQFHNGSHTISIKHSCKGDTFDSLLRCKEFEQTSPHTITHKGNTSKIIIYFCDILNPADIATRGALLSNSKKRTAKFIVENGYVNVELIPLI